MFIKGIALAVAAICIIQCNAASETFDRGIERISLNALGALRVWQATGTNGTEGACS